MNAQAVGRLILGAPRIIADVGFERRRRAGPRDVNSSAKHHAAHVPKRAAPAAVARASSEADAQRTASKSRRAFLSLGGASLLAASGGVLPGPAQAVSTTILRPPPAGPASVPVLAINPSLNIIAARRARSAGSWHVTSSRCRLTASRRTRHRLSQKEVSFAIEDLEIRLCANPKAAGTPGTGTFKARRRGNTHPDRRMETASDLRAGRPQAKCYEIIGTAVNNNKDTVNNADVYGIILGAEELFSFSTCRRAYRTQSFLSPRHRPAPTEGLGLTGLSVILGTQTPRMTRCCGQAESGQSSPFRRRVEFLLWPVLHAVTRRRRCLLRSCRDMHRRTSLLGAAATDFIPTRTRPSSLCRHREGPSSDLR